MNVAVGSRVRGMALALVAGAVLTVPAPAQAQRNDEAFKDGLKARNEKQWAAVVTQMRRAIQADSQESAQKVGGKLGFGGTEYLPHFFLGEAYFRQGNCAAAIQAWSESERQGVIRTRTDLYSDLRNGYKACEARGVLLPPAYESRLTRATQALEDINARARRVGDASDSHREVWNATPHIKEQYASVLDEYHIGQALLKEATSSRLDSKFKEVDASTERATGLLVKLEADLKTAMARDDRIRSGIAEVRRIIESGQKLDLQIDAIGIPMSPSQHSSRNDGIKKLSTARDLLAARTEKNVTDARTSAAEGLALLKEVFGAVSVAAENELKRRLEAADKDARETFGRLQTEFATVASLSEKNPTRVTADMQSQLAALQKRDQRLRRSLSAAVTNRQPAEIDALTRQARDVLALLTELTTAISPRALTLEDRGVPVWLQVGAAHYLAGDYLGALEALDDGPPEGPAELQVHLLRAAAQHALYVRSGEKDASRRDDALAAIARCKAIDPSFRPDTDVFSPRFIEFYQRGASPASR
jgi:hypothetical protein